MDNVELLISEFRDFRREIESWRHDSVERVAALETQMTSILGNGQPGRLTIAERAIAALQSWRWQQIGAAAGIGGVTSVLGWVIAKLVH